MPNFNFITCKFLDNDEVFDYNSGMKEFLKTKKVTYNLMSFTGFKALVLFSLLLETPKSYEEICDYFINHDYLREKISIDTLRVYLTSLKRVGCEVKRQRIDGVSKYFIDSNPFELRISPKQMSSLIKVYKMVSKDLTIDELLGVEFFIRKLSLIVKDNSLLESFLRVSLLKSIDIELLKDLLPLVERKRLVVISYKSPRSGLKDIEVLTSKIGIENNKLYLYGYSKDYKQDTSYLISRISKIKEIKMFKSIEVERDFITVGIEYYGDIEQLELKENEKIISVDAEKSIIEIKSSNEFLIRQRILSMTDNAKILYPENFKKSFILKLKDMKAGYYIG